MVGEQVMFVLSAGATFAEVKAAQTAGQALQVFAKEGAEEVIGGPLPTNPKKLLKSADAPKSKTAQEMADELSDQIGKNSVSFTTPNKTGHIDLRGKSHFDKATQTEVPTPHVQTRDLKVGPNGQVSAPKKTEITKPATKQDIRTARELAKRKGQL
jgi:hypothetical protein